MIDFGVYDGRDAFIETAVSLTAKDYMIQLKTKPFEFSMIRKLVDNMVVMLLQIVHKHIK